MKKPVRLLWPAIAAFLISTAYFACTDPTSIGADLLDEDRLGLDYVDTITLDATVIRMDSVLTYSGSDFAQQLTSHPFGDYTDPLFGRVEAALYAQPTMKLTRFGISIALNRPNFKEVLLDSIVLVMTLDSANFYGAPTQTFGMEVYRVIEDIDPSKEYYSNAAFATEALPLGSVQFAPRLDSLRVIDYGSGAADTISFPHLRIPLNPALGQELIGLDTLNYENDSTFLRVLKGLYFKPTQSTNGLVSFSWRNNRAGLYVYYSNSQGQPRQYQFEINEQGARISTFRHQYAGAPVAPFINNPGLNDSLLFVQGLSGLDVRIELPHVNALQGAIVNYAELEVPLGYFAGDDTLKYPLARELVLAARNSSGLLEPISDVRFSGNQRTVLFGGILSRGANGRPDAYRMNVSSQLADMIYGRAPNVMYLRLFSKAQRSARLTLNGPAHPIHRMRLKVAFTKS